MICCAFYDEITGLENNFVTLPDKDDNFRGRGEVPYGREQNQEDF